MNEMHAVAIDPRNADQARAWDGDEGGYWAEHADAFDKGVARYHGPFLHGAEIGPAARVLDIGCGTGQTTRDAARRATLGAAFGVDLSSQMIAVARAAAEREGVANAQFEQADAQVYPFGEHAYDVAISRTGAMFFGDPPTAFGNIARALRPGGRLALLAWQALPGNEWIGAFSAALAAGRDLPGPPVGAPGPFALADRERVRELLSGAGFVDVRFDDRHEPMYFGHTPDDAFAFVIGLLGWMLHGLDDAGTSRARSALRASIEAHHSEQGVTYDSAAWIITARTA
jgi:SAM-dependent methyltransferase